MHRRIRTALPSDAAAIGRLAAQSAAYLRALGDTTNFKFNAEIYLRDGFGPHAAFAGLVAEAAGTVVGYLLYHFGYDTDRALRLLWVIDLLVDEAWRGQGVGQQLMQQAAEVCRAAGGSELVWMVYKPNAAARKFYLSLGAELVEDLDLMRLGVVGKSEP